MAKQATGHSALGTKRMWLIIIASHMLVAGLALLLIEGAALVRLTRALDAAKSVSGGQLRITLLLFVPASYRTTRGILRKSFAAETPG